MGAKRISSADQEWLWRTLAEAALIVPLFAALLPFVTVMSCLG